MSKYAALRDHLSSLNVSVVPMTFGEIEKLIGGSLPSSAYKHRAWWSNNPSNSVITYAWLAAGYESADVDMGQRKLVFRRKAGRSGSSGKGSASREHAVQRHEVPESNPLVGLYGALRGTVHVVANLDLTEPASDEWPQ